MSVSRKSFCLILAVIAATGIGFLTGPGLSSQTSPPQGTIIAGRNVNMVSGAGCIDGDPYLQRQNEPSAAVSTRNSLTLMAGANDYRLVDMPVSEGPLPGIPEGAAAGDAWLGLFKSINGGESWTSALLPGHPRDPTAVGRSSPLFGLTAASDPTVRAGSNGLFYYSGIAFDRVARGRSVIFVARFIDNNFITLADKDPIEYLDTKILDEGTSGQFADKPWIAVAAPRSGEGTVPVHAPGVPVQYVARHDVYMAYSIFLGNLQGGDQSKIMFVRSTDCGTTWLNPVKVSESNLINQGTTLAISPKDGTIYLAWRRFSSSGSPSAIMISQSRDFGATFTKAAPVAYINAFDQYSAPERFRTYAFPTLAVDKNGVLYAAWSERGLGPVGDARIVISASTNGTTWTTPKPVDNHGQFGHQIMPSLTFSAGLLRMTWYDTRRSEGGPDFEISDPGMSGKRHTLDVWTAQALPGPDPDFSGAAAKVTKYLHWWEKSGGGPPIAQKEASHPNYSLFAGGTQPFMGDYIDIAPSPGFLFDVNIATQTGYWRFNTEETDPASTYVTWTDNRDVKPGDGIWTNYTPPSSPCSSSVPSSCDPLNPGTTGKRNQNIYVSHITPGLLVGAPVNTKPLWVPTPPTDPDRPQRRSFIIFVKNLTEYAKQVRLTIEKPEGLDVSFWEEFPVPEEGWQCPFLDCDKSQLEAAIAQYSTLTLTVFVVPNEALRYATFRIKVEELGGSAPLTDYIVLNPDPENTRIVPAVEDYHTPDYVLEPPVPVNFTDPTVLSEPIVYLPDLQYIVENVNPDVVTPTFRSPTFRSGNVVNPTFRSSSVEDVSGGTVTDIQWRVTNVNDATSAYSFIPIGYAPTLPEGGACQLLIYRVSTTPAAGAASATNPDLCRLYGEEHHDLLLKVESPTFRSPTFRSPTFRSPTFRSPTFRSNTFSLAPGEEAVCALRFITPPEGTGTPGTEGPGPNGPNAREAGQSGGFDIEEYAKTVAGSAVAQACNPNGEIYFASSLYIIDKDLPPALANDVYSVQLEAFGGIPVQLDDGGTADPGDDIHTYQGMWKPEALLYPSGLASGLYMDTNGLISGQAIYHPGLVYPQVVSFTAEVKDLSAPQLVAHRDLSITVSAASHTVRVTAGPNGSVRYTSGGTDHTVPPGSTAFAYVPHGESQLFTMAPDLCSDIEAVTVKEFGVLLTSQKVAQYLLTNVRSDGFEIAASFQALSFGVTAGTETTPAGEDGGTISPSGIIPVLCGGFVTFEISPKEGYAIADVVHNGNSMGPLAAFGIGPVVSIHSVVAKFRPLEAWALRYNNDGDDQARSVAVYGPTGGVFVTGYSTGRTSGPDVFTIGYDGEGAQSWTARYDGPAHLGDFGNLVAADAAGNIYVAGYGYRGQVVKHADFLTLKYDRAGRLLWDAQYDDRRNGNDEIRALAVDAQGFVYVAGRSEDSLTKTDVKHYDYYTIKYDPATGKPVWEARYNGTLVPNSIDEPAGIAIDAAGNVYVTGRSQKSGADFDCLTVKYDAGGALQWAKRYDGGSGADEAAGIALDAAGNILIAGRSRNAGGDYDGVTIKYGPDAGTAPLWAKTYANGYGDDEAAAVAVDPTGNVLVVGRSKGNGAGFDYFTVRYDSGGAQRWAQRYDNIKGVDEAAAVALDGAGNVMVTGRSEGTGTGFDFLTLKYDSSGRTLWRARYDNRAVHGADEAVAVAIDAAGNIYVTGRSPGGATGFDYVTVKYR